MSNLKMVRVDYRMIHGQIVAKWIKFHPVDRLILADNDLAKDSFMADIYRMAVPNQTVDIVNLSDLKVTIDKNNDNVMLIFKDVATAFKVFQMGIKFPELNIGAVQGTKERKAMTQGVSLSLSEFDMLLKINNAGTDVFLQPIPEKEKINLASLRKKF